MLTQTEVWGLMTERFNRAEIAQACECDETVARALMIAAAMGRGIDERNPRRIIHLSRAAVAASGLSARCSE
jgi:hypothetical protein